MNKNNNQQNKNQELGALWKRKSKNGVSFLSGYITDHDGAKTDVVVFANSNKSNEKAPDYRLYVSKPLEKQATKNVVTETPKKKAVQAVQEDEDDIL